MEFLNLPKLFASTFYAIPDYQRDYEWTNVQNMTLLDDVFSLFDASEGNHFFGAIVTIPYEESNGTNKSINFSDYNITDIKNIKHVVDGQQRLTSFSILAKAICDLIEEKFKNDSSFVKAQSRKLDSIYFSIYSKGYDLAPSLILNDNTGYCYNHEILKIASEEYSKKPKGAKRILGAYNLFKTEIPLRYAEMYGEDFSKERKFYENLVETLLNKVTMVEISCDASSNAFQVFDSLNGKGLDLTAADRIKNILMSWAPKEKRSQIWVNFEKKVGEGHLAGFFVSYFFYTKKKRISKNKLPDEFKNEYNSSTKDFDDFVKQLYEYGEIYGKLRRCETNNKNLNTVLESIKKLNMEQVYVMLFAAILKYGSTVISLKEFVDYSKTLIKLVVRMQVCEKSMNRLDSHFSTWISKMEESEIAIKDITSRIANDIKQIVPDENFKQSFAQFAPADNKVSEYYLIQIEEFLRRTINKDRNPVNLEGLSVEHIIPQEYSIPRWYENDVVPPELEETFAENVVENIGNKALIYGDDNSAANNYNYEKKLYIYKNGKKGQTQGIPCNTFVLIKQLVEDYPEKFIHEQVSERAKKLAEIAVQIW
ncbi:MAG: DUF262 domain-containing protein [Fibrobacter sp.]|uniref:DUF262 domain-containing protein n=1 Tax=Fibrobacter sp. TaxID=35828 RepID=UPI0025BB8B4B|nr:DUF262 domain-containing protein [Fibrobacter sp.]MBR4785048.1 DUF262 domain-containing protein [Fibrobacter sp.]